MHLKLKIFRYNPEKKERKYDYFEVPYEEGMTFLRAFQKIKEEIDPSFSFRAFCRAGICGTCTVFIDGFPKLACKEQTLPYILSGRTVVVEPLDKFDIVRDLVVDNEEVINRMKKFRTWIKGYSGEVRIPPEVNKKIEKGADCILCSACQSYCPQVLEEDYAGPLFFAKIYRFLEDPRDSNKELRIKEALEGNLYHCLSCNKCNNVCPKDVEPATLIRELMLVKSEVS
ncbi:MAG TPA: succinate dehydrogenase/fumarate reductase iron-sulfur subunit [Aquifex aeolicus]|nr:succinate dehydrogenase/fumarate reductase iron-sulfur subunit [Aquifex aeolicus]